MFNLNAHMRKKEYHVFSTDNYGLTELGLALYTKDSLRTYFGSGNPDIVAFFRGDSIPNVKNQLLANDISTVSLIKFDKEDYSYKYESGTEIFNYTNSDGSIKSVPFSTLDNFLNCYDKTITTSDATISGSITRGDVLEIANKIENSLSGCLSFTASYKALDLQQNARIKLRLLSRERSNDQRLVALKGSPIIAGIPTTISNLPYGQAGTNNSDLGIFQRPSEGGINNPANSVAAPLDIRYDKASGKWKAGTHQILSRLTTDVDSANIGSIDGITGTDSKPCYTVGSPNYIGQFSTGKAIPLSMENGNPYMYGPNFIGCPSGSREIEEIQVTNRSNRTFKRGDVVLLSHIDTEWIIQGFDTPIINKTSGVGRWQFQKFIVTSEDFFRDARYKEGTGFTNNAYILPLAYESKMRMKYFAQFIQSNIPIQSGVEASDKQEAALLSLYIDDERDVALDKQLPNNSEFDIILSDKYYQSSIFDQLHGELGGTNEYTLIGRTNVLNPPIEDEYIYMRDVPYFWGASFPNGYTTTSIFKLKSAIGKSILSNSDAINNINQFFSLGESFSIQHDDDKHVVNQYFTVVRGLFKNSDNSADPNLFQLPAEFALNGSLKGKFSYPIERINIPLDKQTNLPLHFYDNLFNPVLSNRYSWLMYEDPNSTSNPKQKKDLIDLSPAQPNVIQFSPLQLETALSTTIIDPQLNDTVWGSFRNILRGKNAQLSLDNNLIESNSFLFFPSQFMARNFLTELTLSTYGKSYLKFGQFTKHHTLQSAPYGGPGIIPEGNDSKERSNLIGIIASKNKFSTPADLTVTFTTKQQFGLSPRVTIGGGQGPLVTILGPFVSWATGGNSIKNNAFPQWGDSSRTNAINSMGTTALHIRMFDEWPDEQTFYDGRYFAVLHFNPINGVDFIEPTLYSGGRIGDGTIVTFSTVLKPKSEWFINRIRRGTLVSGGFRYHRRVIGIDPGSITILKKSDQENLPTGSEDEEFKGTGYQVGDTISFAGGAKIEITSVGENGSLVQGGWIIPKDSLGNFELGEGYLPNQFYDSQTKKGGLVGTQTSGAGVGAKLFVKNGKAYKKAYLDAGPKERVPITKLTLSSEDGKQKASGTLKTQITPQGGNGRYDCFYFMHNDILHTPMNQVSFDGGFAQYIILEIGAN